MEASEGRPPNNGRFPIYEGESGHLPPTAPRARIFALAQTRAIGRFATPLAIKFAWVVIAKWIPNLAKAHLRAGEMAKLNPVICLN